MSATVHVKWCYCITYHVICTGMSNAREKYRISSLSSPCRERVHPTFQANMNESCEYFTCCLLWCFRWAKLRAALVPLTIILEPVSECMLLGLLNSWAVTVLFPWSGLAFFFVHMLLWFVLDYILLQVVQVSSLKSPAICIMLKICLYWHINRLLFQNGPVPFTKFEYCVGWLFRECTSFYLLLKASCSPLLVWRNKSYRLYWGGIGEEVRTKAFV